MTKLCVLGGVPSVRCTLGATGKQQPLPLLLETVDTESFDSCRVYIHAPAARYATGLESQPQQLDLHTFQRHWPGPGDHSIEGELELGRIRWVYNMARLVLRRDSHRQGQECIFRCGFRSCCT